MISKEEEQFIPGAIDRMTRALAQALALHQQKPGTKIPILMCPLGDVRLVLAGLEALQTLATDQDAKWRATFASNKNQNRNT